MKRLLPAYPLFLKDPYFSLWSPTDELNASDTMFWTGKSRPAYGVVTADGKSYCFMGRLSGAVPLAQTSVSVTAFTTDYAFTSDAFDLKVRFLSPLDPTDLSALSRPVCYLLYEILPKRALTSVTVSLILDEANCYETPGAIRGGVLKGEGYESAWFGLRRQLPLSQTGDAVAADWGYTYLTAESGYFLSEPELAGYLATGNIAYSGAASGRRYIAGCDTPGAVDRPRRGKILAAFDDLVSIFYFGEWLKGYYFADGKTVQDAIREAYADCGLAERRADAFDSELARRAAPYGEEYVLLLRASLRQSVAAHKLVKNGAGEVLFLSKECRSNGCIATVDITYPSSPLYLLYNPELLKGMLRPIFRFASLPVWPYPYAPHDAGTYPYCLGQTYGLREKDDKYHAKSLSLSERGQETYAMFYTFPKSAELYTEQSQMPVEECGNMLILTAAALLADGDKSFAEQNYTQLFRWYRFLADSGLVPTSQLCTDDFAGHLDKNVNLAAKAVVGIAAFGIIAEKLGKNDEAEEAKALSRRFAAEWRSAAGETSPLPLSFGAKGTFSLKYNAAFDMLFGTGLFDPALLERETDCYAEKCNAYGAPLDSRATYTKSDWLLWCAALTERPERRAKLLQAVCRFLSETPDRVPFTDWYDTVTGKQQNFQNRSVQGGLFILLLKDSGILRVK